MVGITPQSTTSVMSHGLCITGVFIVTVPSGQHVDVSDRLVNVALACPTLRKKNAGSGAYLDFLTCVGMVGRAARDEMAKLVARQAEPPASRGADPDAGLGRVSRPLVEEPARRL